MANHFYLCIPFDHLVPRKLVWTLRRWDVGTLGRLRTARICIWSGCTRISSSRSCRLAWSTKHHPAARPGDKSAHLLYHPLRMPQWVSFLHLTTARPGP